MFRPLLFLIYINNLPSCLKHANPRMYADDTNLTISDESVSDIEEKLNYDLENLKLWLIANKLSLNIAKTEYILVGSRYRAENTIFCCKPTHWYSSSVKGVHTSKSLGIWIDENLTLSSQIDAIAKKISSAIGGLRQIKSFVPQKAQITIYNALILPLFDYCDQIWENTSKGNLDCFQRLQNRAARVITKSECEIRSRDILNNLKWGNLDCRRNKHELITMYKILNSGAPSHLGDQFTTFNTNYIPTTRTLTLQHELSFYNANSIPTTQTLTLQHEL